MSNKKLVKTGKPRSFKILEKIDDIIKLQQMKEVSGRKVNPKNNKISLKDIVFEMREEMRNGFTQINKRLDNHQQSIDELKTDVNVLRTDVNTLKGDVNTLKTDVNTLKGDVNNIKVVMVDLIETNSLKLTKTKLS